MVDRANDGFRFSYEEWELKSDSNPGWDLVMEYLKNLSSNDMEFNIWIFKISRNKKVYHFEKCLTAKSHDWEDEVREAMYKDTYSVVKCMDTLFLSKLLDGYQRVSTGILTSTNDSRVFITEIDWKPDIQIKYDEVLLLVNHDGEPIYLLRNN